MSSGMPSVSAGGRRGGGRLSASGHARRSVELPSSHSVGSRRRRRTRIILDPVAGKSQHEPSERTRSPVPGEVGVNRVEQVGVVLDGPGDEIAPVAQKLPDLPAAVIVIDGEPARVPPRPRTVSGRWQIAQVPPCPASMAA